MRNPFTLDGPLPPLFIPLIGALIAIAAARGGPAHAQENVQEKLAEAAKTKTYVIASADGYGIADCFKQGVACGEIVASSWCEGHGHGKPAAWGSADDLTASIPAGQKAPAQGALVITCHE